jgi:hypothetical protein
MIISIRRDVPGDIVDAQERPAQFMGETISKGAFPGSGQARENDKGRVARLVQLSSII